MRVFNVMRVFNLMSSFSSIRHGRYKKFLPGLSLSFPFLSSVSGRAEVVMLMKPSLSSLSSESVLSVLC